MKRIFILLMCFALLLSFAACSSSNNFDDNDDDEEITKSPTDKKTENENEAENLDPSSNADDEDISEETEDKPYDKDGILYDEYIEYYLGEYGSVYWNVEEEFYVLNPRATYRQAILGLVADPFNETYLELWDLITELIRLVSEEFPSAICVVNPANPKAYLLIVVMGEVGYSAF